MIASLGSITAPLVAQLDQRGEAWDLYRAYDGGWIVKMGGGNEDPARRSVRGASIEEALTLAVASPRLPVVPQKPSRYYPGDFVYTRQGRGWRIDSPGGYAVALTKREAEAYAQRRCEQSQEKADAWEAEFGALVRAGEPGKDYYWQST